MKKAILVFLFAFSILFVRVHQQTYLALAEETQAVAQEEHAGQGGQTEHEETIGQTIGKWINFAALVAILYLFLKKSLKIQDKFKADAEEIQRSIESARLAKEEAERRLQEMDQKMTEISAEIEKIRANAVREAEEEKKRILESARKEAERLVEFAHREIDAEVNQAKKDLRQQVVEAAVTQSRKIIEREMNDKDHDRLVSDYIEGFGK